MNPSFKINRCASNKFPWIIKKWCYMRKAGFSTHRNKYKIWISRNSVFSVFAHISGIMSLPRLYLSNVHPIPLKFNLNQSLMSIKHPQKCEPGPNCSKMILWTYHERTADDDSTTEIKILLYRVLTQLKKLTDYSAA